jgi:RimJ/RimL family protein N-acetyltransferase
VEVPLLETERLLIRPLEGGDLAACLRVLEEGAATAPERVEERRSWLDWTIASYRELGRLYQPPYGERAIALRASGEVVGLCGYVPSMGPFGRLASFGRRADARLSPEVGLFWALAPEHRRRGYATEAARELIRYGFERLGLGRIVATTEYENEASQAVMRRAGMRLERNPLAEPGWFQVVGVIEAGG